MKKVLTVIISAIGFGLIAGLVMVGVNFVAKDLGIIKSNVQETTVASTQAQQVEEKPKEIIREYVTTSDEELVTLVEENMPSIVSITNMQKFQQNGFSMFGFRVQPQEYEAPAAGSGVIVTINDEEIIMLTNNHVVENSSSMTVTFNESKDLDIDAKEYTVDAAIKGTDSKKDLAIISVKKDKINKEILKTLVAINKGNSDNIKVGERVVAIGNALGIGQSVTTGIVSAKDRVIDGIENSEKLIQTDAAINPGNSGGALLNMKGELIGINVAKSAGNAIEGVGYAIPINSALDVIDTLSVKKDRTTIPLEEQGYLGVVIKNIDSATAETLGMPEGIYVYQIQKDSAAEKSDMKEKDIIVEFDDQAVKTSTDLSELVSFTRFDQEVTLKVKRLEDGKYVEKSIKVKMGKRPKEEKTEEQSKDTKESQQPQDSQGGFGQGNGNYYYDPFEDFFGGGGNPFRGFGLW